MKPIYIMLAAWGEAYIDAMCSHLIRSLLTPHNVMLLDADDGHRFVVATTADDWRRFEQAPEFALLTKHMKPDLVELPLKRANITIYQHMTDAHRMLVEKAAHDRAFSCMLAPDVYLSEGFVEVLVEHSRDNTEVLLISAWHIAQRKLFERLATQGLLFSTQIDAAPAIRPGADALTLGRIAAEAIHPCVACMEWDSPCFDKSATFVWWRLPGEPALLLHCMFWVEMGLDYSALKTHRVAELEHATIEALYVQDNFGENPTLAVVDNGARAFVCSWKEDDFIAEGAQRVSCDDYVRARARLQIPLLASFIKGIRLRAAFYRATSRGRDKIKGRLIFRPVIWGRKELVGDDLAVEHRAQRVLRRYIGDFDPDQARMATFAKLLWFLFLDFWMHALLAYRRVLSVEVPLFHSYLKVIVEAIAGDRLAREQIRKRISLMSNAFLRRT